MQNIKSSIKSILPKNFLAWLSWIRLKQKKHLFQLKKLTRRNDTGLRYIVTMTTYGKRLHTTAPYAIASLLRQTESPDRIILWLAKGTAIPGAYKKLVKYGLEIRFCDDIRSYKKLVPALTEFPTDVLITVDDDVFYPKDWFSKMKYAHVNNPDKICAVRAHEVTLDNNYNIDKYDNWAKEIACVSDFRRLFPTGVSGILYPPNSLNKLCTHTDLFQKLAPYGDDIWFWAMAKLNNTHHHLVHFESINFDPIDISDGGLWENQNSDGGNDQQVKAVIKEFPEVLSKII